MAETTSTSGLKVGQYYYNLETYPDMESTTTLFAMVNGQWEAQELVGNGEIWYKVGIQAPAGTQAVIDGQTIMVGRSGIYELDDGIAINSLKFVQPVKYVRDEATSNQHMDEGIAGMNEAQAIIKEIYYDENGNPKDPSSITEEDLKTGNEACIAYNEAYKKYLSGKNGIYTKGEVTDLKNIVIDFTYVVTNTVVEGE